MWPKNGPRGKRPPKAILARRGSEAPAESADNRELHCSATEEGPTLANSGGGVSGGGGAGLSFTNKPGGEDRDVAAPRRPFFPTRGAPTLNHTREGT